ncbi:MAG TPA: PAS domain-containing protein, partial [Thermomicrobiales bacterium]|nr:PAS domain-containing protein [Thermomicrobiales bacterium]
MAVGPGKASTIHTAEAALPEAGVRPEDLGIGVLFSAMRDAVVVGDAVSGRIVLWNPAAQRLFGYTAEQAVGQLLEILVPEALKPRHRAGLVRYAESGHGRLIDRDASVELPALGKGGAELTVELSLAPVTRPGQDPASTPQYVL